MLSLVRQVLREVLQKFVLQFGVNFFDVAQLFFGHLDVEGELQKPGDVLLRRRLQLGAVLVELFAGLGQILLQPQLLLGDVVDGLFDGLLADEANHPNGSENKIMFMLAPREKS